MTSGFADVDGLLLDIDGVLAVSWQPIAGSVEAMRWIRERGLPFRLITNTTTHTRGDLAATLGSAGFDVTPEEIVTAVVATVTYLRGEHPGAAVYVLSDGDAREDLEELHLVDDPEGADVIVIGGACDDFTYATLNRCFRRVMDGASLVGMHRNLYWRTAEGWQLDGGAFLAGLEEAAGVRAVVCGKPAPAYFASVLELLGVGPGPRPDGRRRHRERRGRCTGGRDPRRPRAHRQVPAGGPGKGAPDPVVDALADLPGMLGG